MRSCCKRPDHALHDLLQDREDKLRELLPHEQIILRTVIIPARTSPLPPVAIPSFPL